MESFIITPLLLPPLPECPVLSMWKFPPSNIFLPAFEVASLSVAIMSFYPTEIRCLWFSEIKNKWNVDPSSLNTDRPGRLFVSSGLFTLGKERLPIRPLWLRSQTGYLAKEINNRSFSSVSQVISDLYIYLYAFYIQNQMWKYLQQLQLEMQNSQIICCAFRTDKAYSFCLFWLRIFFRFFTFFFWTI